MLRPAEAAEMIGISRTKFYQLLSSGQIPTVKIGKCRRIRTSALRDWVRAQPAAPPAPNQPGTPNVMRAGAA